MIPGWQMEAYERLRTEIVKSAVKDLKKALKKSDREGAVCKEQVALERWFLSKWGQLLSGDNGEYIVNRCHKSYKVNTKKPPAEPISKDVEEKAYMDYKAGMSKQKIVQKHNITIYQYYKMLRRRGDKNY